ncbi:putative DNA-binding protein containing a Zn-ribbon domain [Methanonatronarchaeum thermophilum]|uniref:Putative DNA-binding protein containing a Zn-ribbon domain n=1 Tax=Methanonatronarchaeum thermophilum TaxID=1927129 RepID=A0A1Y3GFS6_9EURY|nr:methanogenesis marker protein 11 [Methanonatronarchaeum thermophilum]OUJ18226.1 putative DNA-binding protein containing a Zn-ribbon domain [Methanonatronarchaeum thermophilum]
MEILKPEQIKELLDEAWVSPYERIIMCADEKNGLVEITEDHARGTCYGGAAWEVRHYQETGSLVKDARREGARNVFTVGLGEGELELTPGIAAAGIESAKIDENEIKVGYAGLAGAGVAVAMCRGLAEGVNRVEVHEQGGGGQLGRASLVVPKYEKITIGIDDTDTDEAGATWALSNEIGCILDELEWAHYLNHTIVQLYTKNPYRTQNGVSISITFAVEPGMKEKFVDEVVSQFKKYTSSNDTAIAVHDEIAIPKAVKKYTQKAKNQMVEIEEAEKIAKENDIDLISVTGEQGKIGALAAIGLSNDPDEAAKVGK